MDTRTRAWRLPLLALLALLLSACVADPPAPRCDPGDDPGEWAAELMAETGCPWRCPPDYAYQPVARLTPGWEERAPSLADREAITVLVIGDHGYERCAASDPGYPSCSATDGSNAEVAMSAFALCHSERYLCDLGLLLGDNFYPLPGEDHADVTSPDDGRWQSTWRDLYEPFRESDSGFRFWATFGNHDYIEGNLLQAQIDYTEHEDNAGSLWMAPGRSVEVPGLPPWLHLWLLDSMLEVQRPKWGTEILEGDPVGELAEAMRGAEGWRILGTHHPALSVGSHGRRADPEDEGFRCQDVLEVRGMREVAGRLAEAGMQVMISGHEHDQQMHQGDGFLQIVQGAASKVSTGNFEASAHPRLFAEERRGFSILRFSPTAVEVEHFDFGGRSLGLFVYEREEIAAFTQELPELPW